MTKVPQNNSKLITVLIVIPVGTGAPLDFVLTLTLLFFYTVCLENSLRVSELGLCLILCNNWHDAK